MAFGDLTTLSDVKAWLSTGQPQSQGGFPASDDQMLARLISAASELLQKWMNRKILSQDWQEVRDGQGGGLWGEGPAGGYRFNFAATPVTAVLLVQAAGVTVPAIPIPPAAPPGQPVSNLFYGQQAGYIFSPTQLVIQGYWIPRRAQCLTMVYTAGYPTVPADLAQACIELVVRKYKERSRVAERTRSLGGGETVSYVTTAFSLRDMTTEIQWVAAQYRVVAPISTSLQPAATQTDTATLAAAIA